MDGAKVHSSGDGRSKCREMDVLDRDRPASRIFVGSSLTEISGLLDSYPAVFAVYDRNAGDRIADFNNFVSAAGIRSMYPLAATEDTKTIETVVDICRWLLENGADRDALLLGIGGGIITDIAGFAASIYKRGIRFAYVPTTLLAQVDASIGGKTGVNMSCYKNMLGTIRQPDFTWICPEVLSALSYRDFLSGAAEMLKTFIISDNGDYVSAVSYFKSLYKALRDENISAAGDCAIVMERGHCLDADKCVGRDGSPACRQKKDIRGDGSIYTVDEDENSADETERQNRFSAFVEGNLRQLGDLVAAAAAVKADIVSQDQFETGCRRMLNLGHTFAHAMEWYVHSRQGDADETGGNISCLRAQCSRLAMSHGAAVSVGIILATRLSEAVGVAPAGLAGKLRADFMACGLPVDCPFPLRELAGAMARDKKADGGKIHFILIRSIGETMEYDMTAEEAVAFLAGE